jgi:hypothetical protein
LYTPTRFVLRLALHNTKGCREMSAMIQEPHDMTRADMKALKARRMAAMTERQKVNGLFGFGAMVACTGAVAAAMSWAMFIGFVLGVLTTIGASVVVASGLVKRRD